MRKVSLPSLYITLIITGVLVFGSSQIAFADIIIDLDGIATDGLGEAADQEVSPGDDLVAWPAPSDAPLPPAGERAGIDWVDRDQPTLRTWTDGDSLFSEDANLCPTAIRDQKFNAPLILGGTQRDCLILEGPLGAIPNDLVTDCDLETGGSNFRFPFVSRTMSSPLFQNPFLKPFSSGKSKNANEKPTLESWQKGGTGSKCPEGLPPVSRSQSVSKPSGIGPNGPSRITQSIISSGFGLGALNA